MPATNKRSYHLLCFVIVDLLFKNVQSFIFITNKNNPNVFSSTSILSSSVILSSSTTATTTTELPDSLEDSAVRAAEATVQYCEVVPTPARCRIDFDTSIGDETYSIMKTSTDFMQQYVSALCYALIPGLQQQRQQEMMNVIQAKAALKELQQTPVAPSTTKETEDDSSGETTETPTTVLQTEEEKVAKEDELVDLINRNGRPYDYQWEGPIARIYFPDEGSAAYAKQQWLALMAGGTAGKVPPCCEFSSCGGVPVRDISRDMIVFFFCPRASDADNVESILRRTEESASGLKATVFVNPNLVDMGVTGFGMAGRRLRERLLDPLVNVYYLRTLQWGALTRQWPNLFSVWQEDVDAAGGYRLLENLDRLPSNPEVEDIYDIANGIQEKREDGGLLDQFGDFVNGMMRL